MSSITQTATSQISFTPSRSFQLVKTQPDTLTPVRIPKDADHYGSASALYTAVTRNIWTSANGLETRISVRSRHSPSLTSATLTDDFARRPMYYGPGGLVAMTPVPRKVTGSKGFVASDGKVKTATRSDPELGKGLDKGALSKMLAGGGNRGVKSKTISLRSDHEITKELNTGRAAILTITHESHSSNTSIVTPRDNHTMTRSQYVKKVAPPPAVDDYARDRRAQTAPVTINGKSYYRKNSLPQSGTVMARIQALLAKGSEEES